MCCLYGVFGYGEPLPNKDLQDLINQLGISAIERGTDATGIAYIHKGKLCIEKEAKPAYDFNVKLPKGINTVMGHTRMATQGKAEKNYNNHPFRGKTATGSFALAHNGVLYNDKDLRLIEGLPDSKTETDSYIAVQLLERKKALNAKSIQSVVEQLEGSYCFSILDDKQNLYLIKGNNPLYVLHHKELKLYLYASTEQILWRGIVNSNLFSRHFQPYLTNANNSPIEEIIINQGDIIQIARDGFLSYKTFTVKENTYLWNGLGRWGAGRYSYLNDFDIYIEDYIEQLKTQASYLGLDEYIVDGLLNEGFCVDEIEDFIYEQATGYSSNDYQLQL